jgi:uncharacterized membrane protein
VTEYKGETSVFIQAPAEVVYSYLADFTRHPEWAQNLKRVTQSSSGPPGVGATFVTEEGAPPMPLYQKVKVLLYFFIGVLGGARSYSQATISALEPNRRIAWKAGVPKGNSYFSYAEWEFILEPQGTATRLTQRFRYAPPDAGGQRMIKATGVEGIKRACAVNLAHLKRRLEQSTSFRR